MFLDASGFHAGSFAPALSGRKVHPVYRLRFSTHVRRIARSDLQAPSRISSTGHCAAPAWYAPVEVRRICCGIPWLRPCCVKAHRSRTLPPSCVTAPLRRRRFTPKWISRLCRKLLNPGRRRSHVDPSCRDLSGRSSGGWFRFEVSRFSVEQLRCFLGGEKEALRFYRYRHRMGGIGTIGSATCPSARDGHSISPLSPR